MWLRQLFQSTATDQNSIFIYLHESHALAYEECLYPSDSSRYDFTKTPVAPHAGTPQIHNHATAAVRTFLHMRALDACCARRICRQLTTGLIKNTLKPDYGSYTDPQTGCNVYLHFYATNVNFAAPDNPADSSGTQ